MIPASSRTRLQIGLLALAMAASVAYDSLVIQKNDRLQLPLGVAVAACLAAVGVLSSYSLPLLRQALIAAWPLHFFAAGFAWATFAWHGGGQLRQFAQYTLVGYAVYLVVPLVLCLNRSLFVSFAKWIALVSAALAVPSLWGAAGFESFAGLPLRVKFSYAQLSGIPASAGIFEHPEGHAFQMAIGICCCFYAWRSSGRWPYLAGLLLTGAGLVVSQGRAAIYGLAVAVLFWLLPKWWRRSRPAFLVTLVIALTFPFAILPQLALIPGLAGYLRLERGLSGRAEAWQLATEIVAERPWTGYGFMASTYFTERHNKSLRKSGFSGAGTTFHNTFISKAVDLGLVVTGLYALLYVCPLLRICRDSRWDDDQHLVRSLVLLTLTTAIFRDYNIGGVRSTALIGAMFLGFANLWPAIGHWTAGGVELPGEGPDERRETETTASPGDAVDYSLPAWDRLP